MKYLATAVAFFVLLAGAAFAQAPKSEVGVDFSMINVHPNKAQITSFNFFGGGGNYTYNIGDWFGIKSDFQWYTQGSGLKSVVEGVAAGNVSGNTFTYTFGPQIKKHSGWFQPFGEALFGGAYSNVYANLYVPNGKLSGSGSANAFAMKLGGGLDIALAKHFQVTPARVDDLYTGFAGASQNNFVYEAGAKFVF